MEALTVVRPESLPVGAIVLANSDFLTQLADIEVQAGMLEVTDAAAEQEAFDMLNEVTKAGTSIEEKRAELTAPFLQMQRNIKAAADTAQVRIAAIKKTINGKAVAYREAEEEKARKLEADRQAEIQRQEKERQRILDEQEKARKDALAKAEEERKANAARVAASQPEEMSFEEPPPALPPPPAPIVQTPAIRPPPARVGGSFVTYLFFEVDNPKALPTNLQTISANFGAIRALYVTGWRVGMPLPQCAGVRFWTEKKAKGSGR